jgi:hypothetical protein
MRTATMADDIIDDAEVGEGNELAKELMKDR